MLHTIYCENGKTCDTDNPDELRRARQNENTVIWLDAESPDDADWQIIQSLFDFHPLAIEDARHENQRAKMDAYDEYLFVSVRAWKPDAADKLTTADLADVTDEIDIFLGKNYVVTVHNGECGTIAETRRRWKQNPGHFATEDAYASAILYMILDTTVDGYFPAMDTLDSAIDEIETAVFESDVHALVDAKPALQLRKKLLLLRQTVTPMRDLLNNLLRVDKDEFIPRSTHVYFQDVYDHTLRLVEQVDLHRDILGGVLESTLAQSSNRLNQVMKTMTGISTILMTDALIAGIYGMNFKFMPELETRYGYFWTLGGMAAITIVMILNFKRIRWF